MSTQNLGRVGMLFKREYNSNTSYVKNDIVKYNGSSYVAMKYTQGNLPTNSEYWELVAKKGDKGPIGDPGASPLVASSTSEMVDTDRIYVNTTDGHWYSYDGTNWFDGGVYQSTGIDENNIVIRNKEPLYCTYSEVDADEVVYGKCVNMHNLSENDRSNYCYTKTYISGDTPKIRAWCKSISVQWHYPGGAFFADDDTLISKFGDGADNTYYDGITVEVPDSASYVLLNQESDGQSYVKLQVASDGDLEGDIIELQEDTSQLKTTVAELKEKTEYGLNFTETGYITETGYYYRKDSNGSNTGYVEVGVYNRVQAHVNGSPGIMSAIAFYNENKGYLSSSIIKTQDSDYDVAIPENAKYVVVSSWKPASSMFVATASLYSSNDIRKAEIKEIKQNVASMDTRISNLEEITAPSILDNVEFSAFRKWGVIGDSLSVGHTTNKAGQAFGRNIYYSWPQYLARKIGNVCLNFGRSGISAKNFMSQSEPYCYPRLVDPDNLCQTYIIALGANDAEMTLGSINDVNFNDMSQNADTEYGWYARIINTVNTIAPNAPIFLFTLPYPRNGGVKIQAINNMIREFADDERFDNVFLVDLDANYNDYFSTGKLANMIGNTGWHLTAMGYLYASRVNEMALSKVMSDNYDKFQNIPFLPYGPNDVLD